MKKSIKLYVWYKDENGESCREYLQYLSPKRYMCSYSFEKLLKYAEYELDIFDIKPENVTEFNISCEGEGWVETIRRGE